MDVEALKAFAEILVPVASIAAAYFAYRGKQSAVTAKDHASTAAAAAVDSYTEARAARHMSSRSLSGTVEINDAVNNIAEGEPRIYDLAQKNKVALEELLSALRAPDGSTGGDVARQNAVRLDRIQEVLDTHIEDEEGKLEQLTHAVHQLIDGMAWEMERYQATITSKIIELEDGDS